MIRIELNVELNYEVYGQGADFVFNIHAAHTQSQLVTAERLTLNQPLEQQLFTDPVTRNRSMRLHAEPGALKVNYTATVDIDHFQTNPDQITETPVYQLPPEVMGYIYPSRYCESDRMLTLAAKEFGGHWQGYSRVLAIQHWVKQHVVFTSNSTNSSTSAADTLVEQVGVCRDFAHLMIALCRAMSIPARFTTGTDYGAHSSLGPPDFHAYVEVFLGGRWYIFDPSGTAIPMGFVRFGTGRDAADVAFATIFGPVQPEQPIISEVAVEDLSYGIVLPYHTQDALSTDSGGVNS